jgi:hypothetical protein
MREQYTVEIEYGSNGLPYVESVIGAKLRAAKHGNTYTIYGNSEGLLFLAHNLIALAKMKKQPEMEGYHIHLDDLFELNDEGIDFILRALDE